jgi:hypothetical protein
MVKREWEGINGRNQPKLKVPGVMRCARCGRALLHPLPSGEHIGRHCAKKAGLLPGQPDRRRGPHLFSQRVRRMATRRAKEGQVDWVDLVLGMTKEPAPEANDSKAAGSDGLAVAR